jgi:hypothetical protein
MTRPRAAGLVGFSRAGRVRLAVGPLYVARCLPRTGIARGRRAANLPNQVHSRVESSRWWIYRQVLVRASLRKYASFRSPIRTSSKLSTHSASGTPLPLPPASVGFPSVLFLIFRPSRAETSGRSSIHRLEYRPGKSLLVRSRRIGCGRSLLTVGYGSAWLYFIIPVVLAGAESKLAKFGFSGALVAELLGSMNFMARWVRDEIRVHRRVDFARDPRVADVRRHSLPSDV